jgi:hypothetical protein
VSNRQLIIIGSFALACCAILAVAMRKPAPEPPKPDETATAGRYQVVAVPHPAEAPHIVVLDTTTGQTWHLRLPAESKDAEKWKALGSPASFKELSALAVSDL